jgi:hypothetical protein
MATLQEGRVWLPVTAPDPDADTFPSFLTESSCVYFVLAQCMACMSFGGSLAVGAAGDTCEPYMERLTVTHCRVAQVRNKHWIPQAARTVSGRRDGTQRAESIFAQPAHRQWRQASRQDGRPAREETWKGKCKVTAGGDDWTQDWGAGAGASSHRHRACDLAGESQEWLGCGEGVGDWWMPRPTRGEKMPASRICLE